MDPFDVLVVLWFVSAIGGGLALLIAAVAPTHRRALLVTAAALFAVAGVLGILSVGALFLVAAALCAVGARRSRTSVITTRHYLPG
jgi:small-conductance mechanosensitive channel